MLLDWLLPSSVIVNLPLESAQWNFISDKTLRSSSSILFDTALPSAVNELTFSLVYSSKYYVSGALLF